MLQLAIPKNPLIRNVFFLWFILSVLALAFSGLYSFLPYTLRTPFLAKLLNMDNLFNLSLMVHVNLGVLVWFLSCNAMFMTIVNKERFSSASLIAFLSSMTGTIFIIASPFIGESEPIKNNYIPILHNLAFILGISLFLSGILLQSLLTIFSFDQIKRNPINLTIYISSLIFIVASICLAQSAMQLKTLAETRFMDMLEYYELLFWGAGHVLQFNYVQLIIIVWILVADKFNIPEKLFSSFQWLNFILIASCIFPYWIYPLDSVESYDFFTSHMRYTGGILLAIIGAWILFKCPPRKPLEISIFGTSIFMILSGGIIGYLITGANVTIPAHYHGVIIGITIGLMGLFYLLLPKMGFQRVKSKSAIWQLLLYTIGQFIHILALAISGGYGALRKSPGVELTMKAKIFMGIMGIGGTIALIGGIAFVVLIFKNMVKNDE
jgi:cytochrome c oxidase subunit I